MDYLFFALFHPDEEGYSISFPDLPGCLTCGENMSDALYMAKDALEGHLIVLEDEKNVIPSATLESEITVPKGDLLIPIQVNTKIARLKDEAELIKKTVTIPKYLNELGKERNINFSALFTKTLKENLDNS